MKKLSREELVGRVERLLSGNWTTDEMEILFKEISISVPCPYAAIQGYIFHPRDNPDAATIVDRMLAHKAIRL
jgi:hypothetical protein